MACAILAADLVHQQRGRARELVGRMAGCLPFPPKRNDRCQPRSLSQKIRRTAQRGFAADPATATGRWRPPTRYQASAALPEWLSLDTLDFQPVARQQARTDPPSQECAQGQRPATLRQQRRAFFRTRAAMCKLLAVCAAAAGSGEINGPSPLGPKPPENAPRRMPPKTLVLSRARPLTAAVRRRSQFSACRPTS